jgi:G:T-mismatch repair DNA endonuclease (very short patch repair protein)
MRKKNKLCVVCGKTGTAYSDQVCRICRFEKKFNDTNTEKATCNYCGKELTKWHIVRKMKYCSIKCYNVGRIGQKRTVDTKRKIAIANTGKVFSDERKLNISNARKFKPSPALLQQLQQLWAYSFISSSEIMRITKLNHKVYTRLKKEHCLIEQKKFMPRDLIFEEYMIIQRMAKDNIHHKKIAKLIGIKHRKVFLLISKMGLCPVTVDEDSFQWHGGESRPEKIVREFLEENLIAHKQYFCIKSGDKWSFDFHISNTNILIEVHGDYWHCNRNIYVNGPQTSAQVSNVKRDKNKAGYAKRVGYKLIVLWEGDLLNNTDETLNKMYDEVKKCMITE